MSSQIPSPSETQLLYGSLAKQTGGLLMSPQSRDAEKLASGLVTIVKALVGRLLRANAQQQQQQQLPVPDLEAAQDAEGGGGGGFDPALQGFRLIDLSGVNADRACEEDDGGSACYGDVNKIFSIAMDRMVEGMCQLLAEFPRRLFSRHRVGYA